MKHTLVYAGPLQQEYILPPTGRPHNNIPGGDVLYAAAGGKLWVGSISLLARVGENFPSEWFEDFRALGLDTSGINVLPAYVETRVFGSYEPDMKLNIKNPATSYINRGFPFPKELLNISSQKKYPESKKINDPLSPRILEIPRELLGAKALHLAPLELLSQIQLASYFQQNDTTLITVDPDPAAMEQQNMTGIQNLLNGIDFFTPSEALLRKLFWDQTNDLWEMAESLANFGCDFVVVKLDDGNRLLFEAVTRKKWLVPAYPNETIDPTGSTAAFGGGLTAGQYLTYDPVEAVLYGCVSESICKDGTGALYMLQALPDLARSRLKIHRESVKRI